MLVEVKVPTPGESVNEVEITSWLVADGDIVNVDQELAEIESDKATLSLLATEAGKISIRIAEGETVKVGSVACTIDPAFADQAVSAPEDKIDTKPAEKEKKVAKTSVSEKKSSESDEYSNVKITPLAKKMMEDEGVSVDEIIKGLKRLSAGDVERVKGLSGIESTGDMAGSAKERSRDITRNKMSQLRKKLAQRLVSVKNETAMLTTFNEVDMSQIMALRKKYQPEFIEKHGIKLGFMSFFIKASALALKHFPMVNSMIDGDEILSHEYVDISVAVQTPKGLMVPVIRNVETLSLADIENELKELAQKARKGRLSLDEMKGGTFTVTNGGVFGSMMSTPLINPPQSAILGMHNIVERPVAVNGKVEVRPIMYVAISYDHRIVDGKDSVGFLVMVKEMLENPVKLFFGGDDPNKKILNL